MARKYVAPNYFDLLSIGPGSESFSSDNVTEDTGEQDYEDIVRNRRVNGTGSSSEQPREKRKRTTSLRSRAFNQGYYKKFFVEEACLGRGAFGRFAFSKNIYVADCLN